MNNVVSYRCFGTAKVYAQAYEYSITGVRTSPHKSSISRRLMNKALMLLIGYEHIEYIKLEHM